MPSKLIKKSNIQYSTDCFLEKKCPKVNREINQTLLAREYRIS